MKDPNMELVSTAVRDTLARLGANAADESAWDELRAAQLLAKDEDADLAHALETRDVATLQQLVAGWDSNKRLLPVNDREVLKRAMKAFRKSLKVTQLAAESKLGGGPMSSGSSSRIVGIQPPPRYPMPVWLELARQGRLTTDRRGTFELPAGG